MATRRSLDDWNMGLSSSPDAEFGQPSVMSIYGSTIGGLIRYYAAEGKGEVLRTVLAHAIQAGAVSVLAEYRYTDADYRDEHQHFYSTTHRRYPSSAHRLHFFRNESSVVKANHPLRLKNLDYVGYSVLRPVRAAPVGRTMLPALDSNSSILCSAADRVNLYGTTLEARAMPFISQDAQLTRCAHVALWNAAYYHHLTFGGQRIYPGRIATASSPYSPAGRVLPSPGLTVGQVSTISSAIGLPPIVYPLESLARGQEVERIICRYLNSRIPVIITTLHHAFTLIGYERTVNNHGEPSIRFWRHDDEKGLYQAVDDWRRDKPGGGVWRYATVPLPTKIYLPAEDAERIAQSLLPIAIAESKDPQDEAFGARLRDDAVASSAGGNRALAWRTLMLRSNDYKRLAYVRNYPDGFLDQLLVTHMSRWIWVVEITERDSLVGGGGHPEVLAEAVIDTTEHSRDPHLLLWRLPKTIGTWQPDTDGDTVHSISKGASPCTVLSLIEMYDPAAAVGDS